MQRRIIVAASLYGLLVAATWLMPEVAVHGNQSMGAFSLLAIGFLIVCAYASGDIAHAMGIPRITAYLLTGFILGPNVIGIVPQNAIGPVLWYPNDALIQPLTMLTVSLIALRAGSAMSLQTMLNGGKALFSIIAGQLVGILIITTAATVFVLQSAGAILDLPVNAPNIPPLLLGALVAVLCWGGSVAATVNLLDETGARGPVGKQVINSAGLRDLFAVIAFALVLPALNTADSTESAIGLHVLSSTALSIVFGIVIGAALITIRRVTQQDTPLLTLSLVLVCGLLMSAQAPFGPFLIFLIAGFILGNFGRQGPQVVSSLGPIANVVYVVFFASLGVSFSAVNWLAVSVFSVTIFLARWAGLYVGSLAGIRVANLREPNAAIATNSSLPQAGVAVALAILLGETLPGWGPFIRDGLLGAILIAELLGPTFLLRVLQRTGEAAAIDDPNRYDEDELLSPYERVIKVGPDLPAPPSQMSDAASHGLAGIRKGIQVEMDNFADSLAEALADGPFQYLSNLPEAQNNDEGRDPELLKQWLEHSSGFSARSKSLEIIPAAIHQLLERIEFLVTEMRPTSIAERDIDRAVRADDNRFVRLNKLGLRALAKLGLRQHSRRIVGLDRLGAFYLNLPLPEALLPIANLAYRVPVIALERVARAVANSDLPHPSNDDTNELQVLADEVLARAMLLFSDAIDNLYKATLIAGTPSLPRRHYNPAKRQDSYREGQKRLIKSAERWRLYTRGVAGRLITKIELKMIEPHLNAQFQDTANTVKLMLERAVIQALNHCRQQLLDGQERLDSALVADAKDDATSVLRDIRKNIVDPLNSAQRELSNMRDHGQFDRCLSQLWKDVEELCSTLPERIAVPSLQGPLPMEGHAPGEHAAKLSELPFRDAIRACVSGDAARALVHVEGKVSAVVEQGATVMAHVAQVSAFHLDAAATELSTQEAVNPMALAREFAIDGLKRVLERIDDDLATIASSTNQLHQRISSEGIRSNERIQTLLNEQDTGAIELYVASHRGRKNQTVARSESSQLSMVETLEEQLKPFARILTGDREPSREGAERFPYKQAAMATLKQTERLGLPESYMRLFSFNPVGLDEFFVGRNQQQEQLQQALSRWRHGHPTSILVTGPRGSGRSSLIEHMLRHLQPDLIAVRVNLSQRTTTEKTLVRQLAAAAGLKRIQSVSRLIDALNNQPRPTVFLVSPLGRLHLRHRDGLHALGAMQRIIGETVGHVLWLMISDSDTLRSVDALSPLSAAFTHRVELEPMNYDDASKLIRTRHRASGYKLRFHSRSPRGNSEDELRTQFFQELTERSQGVPLLLIYYWLRSLRLDAAHQTLVCELPRALDLHYLDELSTQDLITLGRILVHAGLSASELARVTTVTQTDADAILRQLGWGHLVDNTDGSMHVINPILRQPLRDVLNRRGVL